MTTYESVPRPVTSTMPAWPATGDVQVALGLEAGGTVPDAMTAALQAAIDAVCIDTGWPAEDDADVPSMLWSAALLLTVAAYKAPDAPHGIAAVFDMGALHVARDHPTYIRLLRGHVRGDGFGVA